MPVILTKEQMIRALECIIQDSFTVLDLETTGLNPYLGDEILGVAFGGFKKYFYLPLRHEVGGNAPMECLYMLSEILNQSCRTLLTWNGKYDISFLKQAGLEVKCKVIDVMLNSHLYDENAQPFSLEAHSLARLGKSKMKEQDELIALGRQYIPTLLGRLRSRESILKVIMSNLKRLPMNAVAEYAMNDLVLTEELYEWYDEELEREDYYHLIPQLGEYSLVIQRMEEHGLLIDPLVTKDKSEDAANCMKEIIQEIYMTTGMKINPNSWIQVKDMLLENSEAFRKLPMYAQITNEDTLSKIEDPLCQLITEYHKWSKVKGTYYDMFLELLDKNNRVHPSVKIHGTVTGRLSCPKPAVQTIPRLDKKNYMYRVKDCVIAPSGALLIERDMSQLELRLACHFSEDANMMEAYTKGEDLHTKTATMLGISRQDAKPVNFGFLYGAGAESFQIFAESKYGLKLSLDDAKRFRRKFFDAYPGLVVYNRKVNSFAERNGYIRLWTGRKRHFTKKDDYHKALNCIIQGGAAEMLRISMTRLDREFQRYGEGAPNILIQIHDALLFEIVEGEVDYWMPIIKKEMELTGFKIPMLSEAKVGKCWGGMKVYND